MATTPAPHPPPPSPRAQNSAVCSSRGSISAGPSSRTSLTRSPTSRVTRRSSGAGTSSSRQLGFGALGVEPGSLDRRVEDHRHPVVDRAHERVRGAGDDRAAVQDVVALAARQLGPKPGEREQVGVATAEPDRALAALVGQPLVEAVGGNQAATLAERRRGRPAARSSVSARALISGRPPFFSAQRPGTRPQRSRPSSRLPSSRRRTASTGIGGRDVVARLLVDLDRLEDVEARPQPQGRGR